jgi:ABC-type multidrug transport system fused ATPase/permease subunit
MPFDQKLSLQNIIYQYPEVSTKAINDISFDIYKGQSIGLIGKSGSGKTTLVDIILGLLYPKSGDIQVDGISIYQNLRAWQNLIGYIPQSIFLTDETIEKNIAFGTPDHLIDQVKLEKAIKSAQLEELIQELPQGLKTEVGERGVRLSGGQRQRVGIARALYYEREILVLDEATSALDNETEQLVNESIKSLSGTKTLIIIAHRLSTIEHCDRLYLLGQGKILKAGTYQEVVINPEIIDNS